MVFFSSGLTSSKEQFSQDLKLVWFLHVYFLVTLCSSLFQKIQVSRANCINFQATLKLTILFGTGLTYLPTSMVFLKIPQLSRFEWHPFSIISSSSAQEDTLSILAKSEGEWTEALYTLVQSNINKLSCIPVAVEGPYGPSSLNLSRYIQFKCCLNVLALLNRYLT